MGTEKWEVSHPLTLRVILHPVSPLGPDRQHQKPEARKLAHLQRVQLLQNQPCGPWWVGVWIPSQNTKMLWSEAPNQSKLTQEVTSKQDLLQDSTKEGGRGGD